MCRISLHMSAGVLAALLLGGCASGKGIAEDCTSDAECESNCCYAAQSIHPWCTSDHDNCMNDGGASSPGPVSPGDTSDTDRYDIEGCEPYAEAGLPDAQTRAYCHAAYSHACEGNRDEARAACETLGRFGSRYKTMCPYCQ